MQPDRSSVDCGGNAAAYPQPPTYRFLTRFKDVQGWNRLVFSYLHFIVSAQPGGSHFFPVAALSFCFEDMGGPQTAIPEPSSLKCTAPNRPILPYF